jgi:hypothetical protein
MSAQFTQSYVDLMFKVHCMLVGVQCRRRAGPVSDGMSTGAYETHVMCLLPSLGPFFRIIHSFGDQLGEFRLLKIDLEHWVAGGLRYLKGPSANFLLWHLEVSQAFDG